MPAQLTRTTVPAPDPATRSAMIWATAIAVPVAVLVAVLLFLTVRDPGSPVPVPSSPAGDPAAVPTGPVALAAPRLAGAAATACRSLVDRLPATLRDLPRRAVTGGEQQSAAYGEPPLTVSCGVPRPALTSAADRSAVLQSMASTGPDYVCWYVQQRSDAALWTTVDRDPAVQVVVPSRYEQPAQWVNELSDAITAALPVARTGVPAGCA